MNDIDSGKDAEGISANSVSRRRFLQSVGASGIAAASGQLLAKESSAPPSEEAAASVVAPVTQSTSVNLIVNGAQRRLQVQHNAVLLDVLRDELSLSGTKKGCDHGQCGACTVHVNGISINSCLSLAVMHDGDHITTIEGLERNGRLHPVQQAFWDHDAYQCGYCTSGQIMNAVAVLHDKRIPADEHSVREAMSGNICRCGTYKNIVAAIQDARGKVKGAG